MGRVVSKLGDCLEQLSEKGRDIHRGHLGHVFLYARSFGPK